jgi:serine/threonine protein kinase
MVLINYIPRTNHPLTFCFQGTLEDALQSLRSYGSGIRKSQLSLDIALGLEALHSCNLVHGDIKPSNIIIQAHSSPRVVAKLSDFNGTGHTSSYGKGSRYSFGTPTWQPPEVVCKEDHIDWQIADVYAFGMVFATIWSSTGWIPVGGSFLDPFVPYKLSVPEKSALVEIWKLKQDTDAESMTKLAHRATISDSRAPIPLEFILSSTLSSIPALRLPLCRILPTGFRLFAESCHRSLK